MSKNLIKLINELKSTYTLYNIENTIFKIEILNAISKLNINSLEAMEEYHNVLIFLAAYPDNKQVLKLVNSELNRLSIILKTNIKLNNKCSDTSLPYTRLNIQFSHDLLKWMNQFNQCKISIDCIDESTVNLNQILKFTLPSLEQDITTAGFNNDDLLEALSISKNNRLTFLINEFNKLENNPLVKDYFWELLQINLEIQLTNKNFSKSFNKVSSKKIFYHESIIKNFDYLNLINQKLPNPKKLNNIESDELISTIKKSLVLKRRETDPSTFLEKNTLKYFELERGISIAIFGMEANRQMPLQSYIGYTLFKNGYPMAYGGSWIFGKVAWFGLNVFDEYRGGESGYVMCQLLRVYKQMFNLDYIEVEPYQYGQGNPDGIKSGAFWFYYKYGFRPVDKNLEELAKNEFLKIKNLKGYKTSTKTLLKFTESNIALIFKESNPGLFYIITQKVREMIQNEFKGDRQLAEKCCIDNLCKKFISNFKYNHLEKYALIEIALIANAFKIENKEQIEMLEKMIFSKASNPYLYNKYLTNLLLFIK